MADTVPSPTSMCAMSLWGITSDGLVGPNSWTRYDNYVVWRRNLANGSSRWALTVYQPQTETLWWGYVPVIGIQVCTQKASMNGWRDFSWNLDSTCLLTTA